MNQLSQPVILVIDTDALSLTATSAVLHCQDYVVHCAQDRDAALKAASSVSLDLIICDLNLEGEDGLLLVREIQQMPERADVPVMFASAGQLPDVIRRSHPAGAAYHLKKPFDPQVLLELVDRALWMPHLVTGHMANQMNAPHINFGSGTKTAQPSAQVNS